MALVHYSFPPVIGGVERVLADHATVLAEQGHDVTVVARNEGDPERPLPAKIITLPLLSGSHPEVIAAHAELRARGAGGAFSEVLSQLSDALGEIFAGQDIVFLHNVSTMPFNMPLTAALETMPQRLPGTRFVCWIHDLAASNPDYMIPSGHPWDLLRRTVPGFEYVAVSKVRQEEWCALTSRPPEDCTVIPNGIDPARQMNLSALGDRLVKDGVLEPDLVLLHPCRLLRRKNVELSLRIAYELRVAGVDVLLMMTGAADPHHAPSADYASEIVALRDEMDLRNQVTFLGDLAPVAAGDMPSLYQLADAVLLPSRQEGFGLPMLEAAIHRLPAFCSDIEPLRSLPGAIPFPLTLSPKEISALIIHQMQLWPANLPRKAVFRHHAWPAIYRNYLDPLLRRTNNPHTDEIRHRLPSDD